MFIQSPLDAGCSPASPSVHRPTDVIMDSSPPTRLALARFSLRFLPLVSRFVSLAANEHDRCARFNEILKILGGHDSPAISRENLSHARARAWKSREAGARRFLVFSYRSPSLSLSLSLSASKFAGLGFLPKPARHGRVLRDILLTRSFSATGSLI
jgi:hypothetical protein